jgi:hypothetical protein
MHLGRPVAALMTALALFGGGAATLAGCGDPAGLGRNDGTSDSGTHHTSGNHRSGKSQGDLPDNSNKDSGNTDHSNDDSQKPD